MQNLLFGFKRNGGFSCNMHEQKPMTNQQKGKEINRVLTQVFRKEIANGLPRPRTSDRELVLLTTQQISGEQRRINGRVAAIGGGVNRTKVTAACQSYRRNRSGLCSRLATLLA
ncbi:unnamed protein product [Sphenostylis stenocarpa]|uniref:Uncharacterized protein n=1 Tax=Sphenostylis stenocarpa TaxID=92480 RepID=A0AA86S6J9_9FABA|nr:unnamed protein product [Sphenostylis stenocarpa]